MYYEMRKILKRTPVLTCILLKSCSCLSVKVLTAYYFIHFFPSDYLGFHLDWLYTSKIWRLWIPLLGQCHWMGLILLLCLSHTYSGYLQDHTGKRFIHGGKIFKTAPVWTKVFQRPTVTLCWITTWENCLIKISNYVIVMISK